MSSLLGEPTIEAHREKQGEEDFDSFSSESEVEKALDYLDSREDDEEEGVSFNLMMHTRRPNAHGGLHSLPTNRSLQPMSNKFQKLFYHFRAAPLEDWEGSCDIGMSNSVRTAIRGSIRDMAIGKTKRTDKADRATVEQALDPLTRLGLYKMLNQGVCDYINGCIATGKEANVYHATKSDGQELAIKVYKTSIREYRDRDRYVQGDYRFRYGYCKSNPRKMVTKWAEKEMRNLIRIKESGIRCPAHIHSRLNVLVMEFIGEGGQAAPRLKDAELSLNKLRESYVEGHLYIIDVSQSVDPDHEHADDFLEKDCENVSAFFKKHGVAVMTIPELFEFIVDPTIDDDSIDSYLEEVQQKILARGGVLSAEEEIADLAFVQSFIPNTLDHVKHAEEDVQHIISGKDTKDMYYQTITGLKQALSMANSSQSKNGQLQANGKPLNEDSTQMTNSLGSPDGESETGLNESNDDEDKDSEEGSFFGSDKQTPGERKAVRKENKKKVKKEKREARKSKVPKVVKKKKKKLAKAKKYR
ncbi:hypothetical protein BUALT_Bualt05G0039900 [Buddleja alternifolia]|uniref:Serine/threonine-protein kinase RIO1 n=1 Tax=Buddleja alternifolia TaxID=168488 RepID=A0AAV6XGG7_9LAMI|nr:hypothetical protein BUALT_Bualt05G0039900 [Buddleja alternifolia]